MKSPDTRLRVCWLCGREIHTIHTKAEKHHVRPKRYFRKGSDHRKDNIVKVHSSCHRRLHMELDNPRWKWWEFREAMEPLKFGENVFAGD